VARAEVKVWTAEEIRTALVAQWRALAAAVPALDLAAPTRVAGWTNREVVAHLAAQPLLLLRFLAGGSPPTAELTVATNLGGTARLAALIDGAARAAANADHLDLPGNVDRAVGPLLAADLNRNLVTLQGSITLADYLATRCVEAVVHGLDLSPRFEPQPRAAAVAADALLGLVAQRAPELLDHAARLDRLVWLDAATGRRAVDGPLAPVLPLMT
jgi:Mycothiol maleylpyruvate isomerase N-terminal domain